MQNIHESHSPFRFENLGTVPEIFAAFRAMQQRNEQARTVRSSAGIRTLIAAIVGFTVAPFVSFFVGGIALWAALAVGTGVGSQSNDTLGIVAGIIVGAIGGVFTLLPIVISLGYAWKQWSLFSKSNYMPLDVRKIQIMEYLLQVLQPELKQDAPVQLGVDFASVFNQVSKQQDGSNAYQHHWFFMKMTLQDGSLAQIDLHTAGKRKTKVKRKFNKIKEQVFDSIEVTVSSKKCQGLPPDAASRIGKWLHLDKKWATKVRAAGRNLVVRFALQPCVNVRARGTWQMAPASQLVTGPKVIAALSRTFRGYTKLQSGEAMAAVPSNAPPPGYATR
jgi:uncharacterized membrane protein required for colicin V production